MVLASYCYCGDNAENTDNDCTNAIKLMQLTLNSTQRAERKQKEPKDKKLVFQKNRWKMQAFINPY